MVKELRDATSAGMMDCKRALQETDGDFDAAVKLLRENGMASAAKRADRETTEGEVGYARSTATRRAIAAVGCETEPVSKNEDFLAFAENVLRRGGRARGGRRRALEEERRELVGGSARTSASSAPARMSAADGETLARTSTRRRTRSASC